MSYQGKLSIGDEFQAIRVIAASQLNPQKAVAELIENSIDAGAKSILVTRERTRRDTVLRILDDGKGVALTEREGKGVESDDVEANLKRIPERICDSIKRKLDEQARRGTAGEFGIGMLGFWAVGDTFILRSRTRRSGTYTLTMERERATFEVEKAKEPLESSGTEVTIKRLRETTKRYLSAQRLAKYLSQELRGRLLATGVQIQIDDRLPGGGKIPVQPMPFSGEPLSDFTEVVTRSGRVADLELYMNFGANSSEPAQVGLYRKGTRLVADVRELDEFQRDPWTLNVLEGKIEYPFLSTSPGTRVDVLKDETFEELVLSLRDIEWIIAKRIEARQQELREERASEYAELLKNAFKKVFKDLPREYDFFKGVGPPPQPSVGPLARVEIVPNSVAIVSGSACRFTAEAMDGNDHTVGKGLEYSWTLEPEIGRVRDTETKSCEVAGGKKPGEAVLAVKVCQGKRSALCKANFRVVERCGELSSVVVVPRVAVVWPGHSRNMAAICMDDEGIHVPGVSMQWLCSPTHGTFSSMAGLKATFQAKSDAPLGPVPIKAIARARKTQVEASATLYLVSSQRLGDKFPPYILCPQPLSPRRSEWDPDGYQLQVNSEHDDYKRAKEGRTDLGYIAMLYAKELVLMNFGESDRPSEILERLIEVESRLLPLILGEPRG
jgi:hypothetical protein